MAKKIRVFVYGTLKKGFGNHRVLEGAKDLGRATIKGNYTLVDLGWYPAVVNAPKAEEREIGGEVYEIDHDTLATCDMIEGHPSYYTRQKVMTSLGVTAWVYMLPESYAGRANVGSLFWEQSEAEEAWGREREVA